MPWGCLQNITLHYRPNQIGICRLLQLFSIVLWHIYSGSSTNSSTLQRQLHCGLGNETFTVKFRHSQLFTLMKGRSTWTPSLITMTNSPASSVRMTWAKFLVSPEPVRITCCIPVVFPLFRLESVSWLPKKICGAGCGKIRSKISQNNTEEVSIAYGSVKSYAQIRLQTL